LIKPVLGHLYLDEVTTLEMDKLKQSLPAHYAPSTVNHHLALVRAVLRYALKRNLLQSIPYVPTEKVIRKQPRWYNEAERDRLLRGMFETQPRWYAFFYLTTRLGLRTGEVYAISRDRIRDVPPTLIVDRAVQRGYKDRPAMLGRRRSGYPYSLTTRSVVTRWQAKPRQTANRSEPSRLNSGTVQLRAPRSTRTLVAVLNCASFGRSNRRRHHIVVNIWSTRVKIENGETRNHS
jgi:hypothetical protein